MDISAIVSAIPVINKIVDALAKFIPDKEKAQAAATEIFTLVQGQNAKYWLPANAFTIVMLCNYGLLVYLTVMRLDIPPVVIVAAVAWTVGPLLNCLSKDTLGKLMELVKGFMEWQEARKQKQEPENK